MHMGESVLLQDFREEVEIYSSGYKTQLYKGKYLQILMRKERINNTTY